MELRFPTPSTSPLSINQANKMHWGAKRRQLQPWRDGVAGAWHSSLEQAEVQGKCCSVCVHIPFPNSRRRDPHNYTGTIVKALIDQLVKEGAWPDDTAEFVRIEDPVLVVGEDDVVVRITPDGVES